MKRLMLLKKIMLLDIKIIGKNIQKIYLKVMPTYTVTNSNFNLTSKQQKKLAEGITKVHNVVTGANTYFAQVIFNKTKKNNHFMGGKESYRTIPFFTWSNKSW